MNHALKQINPTKTNPWLPLTLISLLMERQQSKLHQGRAEISQSICSEESKNREGDKKVQTSFHRSLPHNFHATSHWGIHDLEYIYVTGHQENYWELPTDTKHKYCLYVILSTAPQAKEVTVMGHLFLFGLPLLSMMWIEFIAYSMFEIGQCIYHRYIIIDKSLVQL